MHGSARIEVRRVRVGAVQHIYHRGLGVRMDAGASREPGVGRFFTCRALTNISSNPASSSR